MSRPRQENGYATECDKGEETHQVIGGSSDPQAFWEREQGFTLGSTAPAPTSGPTSPKRPLAPGPVTHPPATPAPSAPPARVGGAVAALVVALLTWAVPVLGISLGLWFYILVANFPGVGFAITALVKVPNAPEVERFIRYTWACNFVYIGLSVLFLIPILIMALMALMFSF